jgi:dTDP-4-amino-4,6-dideoxygalactose transaminase
MDVPIVKMPFRDEDIEEIARGLKKLLQSGQIAFGENAKAFEREFAGFVGTEGALGTGSGTQALEILARALDLRGATVMVPDLTFMATALAPAAAGARVSLVDIDPRTLQMDPDDLERKIGPEARAVILVHLGGFVSPDYARIANIARNNGAYFLEDAAHAHGASIDGRMAGSLGDAAAFSFYATKVMTTSEGGMVTTSDKALLSRMRELRQHGQETPGSNVHRSLGLNYRPSEIHALLGLNLMPRLTSLLEGRRAAARVYDSLLKGSDLIPVMPAPGVLPSYYKYIALLPEGADRNLFKERLMKRHGLRLAGEVYQTPLHLQPFWRENPGFLASDPGELPGSLMISSRHVCLPIWPGIPESDQAEVVDALLGTLGSL